jgi:hypothetical protein
VHYEGCGECDQSNRISYAEAVLSAYGSSAPPVTKPPPPPPPAVVEEAFQANTGDLWTTGTGGASNLKLGMMAGTSPSGT